MKPPADYAAFTVDANGSVLTWNAGAERIFGYSSTDLLGRPASVLLADRESAAAELKGLLSVGHDGGGEARNVWWRTRDGRRLRTSTAIQRMNDTGSPEAAFLLVLWIPPAQPDQAGNVARHASDPELWAGERFRAVVESLGEGVVILDTTKRVVYLNTRGQEILGRDSEELVGQHVEALYSATEEDVFQTKVQERLAGQSGHYRAEVRRKDGSKIWVEVRATPLKSPEGQIEGSVAAFADITDHMRASLSVARAERHYRRLVEAAPQTIYALDVAGCFMELNSAGEELVGRTAKEVLGKSYLTVIAGEDVEKAEEFFESMMEPGTGAQEIELRIRRPSGEVRLAEISVVNIEENGSVVGLHGTAHDVTDQRRTAEQYRQAQKMEAIGRLAGGVAHDFNNLLTAITGYTTLLGQELNPGTEAADFVEEIQKAASRSADLTRQLLSFSRRQVVEKQVFDVNRVVTDLERMLSRVIGEDIELRLDLSDEPALVYADPGQITQVVMNLAVNARDAMPDGGEMGLKCEILDFTGEQPLPDAEMPPSRYICLSVTDTGVGMKEETREHMFEPFFTTKVEGTGLGLATVYGIVKQCGGYISVETALGKGTKLRLYFPAIDRPEPTEGTSKETASAAGGNETVLLAEDEVAVRDLAHRILRDGGYRVLKASNGAEALRLSEAFHGPIDLLVTDVVMPQMSGGTLAELLRQRRPHLDVIFITGYADHTQLRTDRFGEGTRLLRKPFSPQQLLSLVRELLDGRQAES